MPKNVQTAPQLHSFHMLAKYYWKFSKLGFKSMWIENSQMFKLDLEKAEEPEIKLPISARSQKKQENSRNKQTIQNGCFIDYLKAFDCVDHNKLWKILQEMGLPDHPPASWEICMQVKKQQLELDMKQQTASK